MTARARAVILQNYPVVARHVGLDPFAMLGRAGIKLTSLSDPEHWIPANRVLNLLEDSAAQSGRDDFGVLLAESRTFASLGPVSLLLQHEPTLRDFINSIIDYRYLINELLQGSLRDDGRTAIIEWGLVPGMYSSQGMGHLATVAYRVMSVGSGCGFVPECIHFRQAEPRHIATFRRVFACSLEFDSSFDGMSFSSAWLERRNEFANPELCEHAHRLLDLLPGVRSHDTIAERVRAVIPMIIASGQVRIEDVAHVLGIPVRTLQRRLVEEGASFSGMLNEIRKELAVRYLADSNQPVTAVAQLVGYCAPSSFTRWFISEFGMAPAAWRSMMRKRDSRHLQPVAA